MAKKKVRRQTARGVHQQRLILKKHRCQGLLTPARGARQDFTAGGDIFQKKWLGPEPGSAQTEKNQPFFKITSILSGSFRKGFIGSKRTKLHSGAKKKKMSAKQF